MPREGGRPALVASLPQGVALAGGASAAWTEDGRIVVGPATAGLHEFSAQGGDVKVLPNTSEGESDFHEVTALPDGKGWVFVVHTKDGTIYKGVTQDFDPSKDSFHFLPAEGGGVPLRLRLDSLKALFWVRDYIGNRDFVARRQFEGSDATERRAIVTFRDGEEIWGTLGEEAEGEAGFYFFPVDGEDNNIRLFVVRSAIRDLRLVQ